MLDSVLEDEIQKILAESRVPRELFSDFSLKETGLITSIPEIKRQGAFCLFVVTSSFLFYPYNFCLICLFYTFLSYLLCVL